MKSIEQLREIARGGIERNLDWDGEGSPDYDDVYVAAFDALVDAKVPMDKAREVAAQEARLIVQQ